MSINASVDIKLSRRANKKILAQDIIESFVSNKWRISINGTVQYLPLGDNGDFDWQYAKMSLGELLEIVKRKETLEEVIGVVLWWDTTDVGISLLVFSELEFSCNFNINRKLLKYPNDQYITDVNWYIEKIILGLKEKGFLIETFSFQEHC